MADNSGEAATPQVWKSTIIVYSPYDPTETELVDLAQDATDGRSYCPLYQSAVIDPVTEPGFPIEFFEVDDAADAIACAIDDGAAPFDVDVIEGTFAHPLSGDNVHGLGRQASDPGDSNG